eukprot:2520926-Ditylum_brightwellii.AAC.1
MEMDALHEDYGKRTMWDKISNNSNNKGDWIKATGKGKCLFSFKVRTEKAEENSIKKMERYGTDSEDTQTTSTLNHRATNNGKKVGEATSQKDAGPESPGKVEQKCNWSQNKAHGVIAINATQNTTTSISNQTTMQLNHKN